MIFVSVRAVYLSHNRAWIELQLYIRLYAFNILVGNTVKIYLDIPENVNSLVENY